MEGQQRVLRFPFINKLLKGVHVKLSLSLERRGDVWVLYVDLSEEERGRIDPIDVKRAATQFLAQLFETVRPSYDKLVFHLPDDMEPAAIRVDFAADLPDVIRHLVLIDLSSEYVIALEHGDTYYQVNKLGKYQPGTPIPEIIINTGDQIMIRDRGNAIYRVLNTTCSDGGNWTLQTKEGNADWIPFTNVEKID